LRDLETGIKYFWAFHSGGMTLSNHQRFLRTSAKAHYGPSLTRGLGSAGTGMMEEAFRKSLGTNKNRITRSARR